MKLTFVHQILIIGAIGLCAIFGLRSIVIGARTGSAPSIGLGVLSVIALAALALYLRRFRAKLAEAEKEKGSAG
jgi:membrane protein implicated in regulation of membrane protease activity